MIVFGGTAGQLDDRGLAIEYLTATIKDKMIMRGHEREGNGPRLPEPMSKKAIPFPPRATQFSVVSTEFTTAP